MKFFLCIILLCFFSHFLAAQITAQFAADHTSGCSPLVVHFTDQSAGTVTYRTWIFGNGNVSHLVNPDASFVTPGVYTVKLIVTDGTNTDSITKINYITVFGKPQSNFTAIPPLSGCIPLTVNFTGQCTPADGPITTYLWDFGDGSTGNTQNFSHTYISGGNFPVSLEITDSHGCSDSKLKTDYIHTTPLPVVSFSANNTGTCVAPLSVNFTNNSTGTGTLSYLWNFGDGTSSTVAAPSHVYNTSGIYTVTLLVTDVNGCQTSLVKTNYIHIVPTEADFDFISNDTVCLGSPVVFQNNSVGAYNYVWNFGNGFTSTQFNPIYIYPLPGTYQIKLIASAGATCKDSVIHTFFVEDVKAAFFAQPLFACDTPAIFHLTDLSINPVSWNWKFEKSYDTAYSSLQNPSTSLLIPGSCDVSLIVTSLHGCKDTLEMQNYLNLQIPYASFTMDTTSGCIPLTIHFTDYSTFDTPFDSIISWHWDFGDGTSSVMQNPSHIYADTGHFEVILTITTSLGCSRSRSFVVMAGIPPQDPVMMFFPDSACASDGITFIDISTDILHNSNLWIFSDNVYASGDTIIRKFLDTGIIVVSLTLFHNGCPGNTVIDNVYSLGPVVSFLKNMNCDTPLVYQFIPHIIGEEKWIWDFGDGTLDSLHTTVNHTYTSGDDTVTLYAFNYTNGCSFQYTQIVWARDLHAQFSISPLAYGCEGYIAQFDPGLSVDYYEQNAPPPLYSLYNFKWNFDDLPGYYYSDSIISHQFLHAGTYHVSLIAQDINGCTDTMRRKINIYKPQADFTSDYTGGCSNFSIHFSDSTMSDTTLSQWYWNFGNSTYSTTQNPVGNYVATGAFNYFNVSLIVIDTIGCSDTIQKYHYITSTNPNANFFAQTTPNICSGDSVRFYNLSGSGLTLFWDFGDGTTSNLQNQYVWHTFLNGGTYSVSLMVTDFNGCQSTKIISDYIHVQQTPDVDFAADTTLAWCYPQLVHFTDMSGSSDVNHWSWNFGDGATSPFENPVHNYTQPGLYSVSLFANTLFGCSDSLTKIFYIRVSGPSAHMSHYPDSVCKGIPITFTMNAAQNVYNYQWDFGDGNFGTGITTTHSFNDVGILYPRLLFSDSANYCQKYDQDTVYIQRVIADFSCSDTIGCEPLQVQFTNNSVGAVNYNWNFGDSSTTTTFNISHTYLSAGLYIVSLRVNNSIGCKDTSLQQIIVQPLPPAFASKDSLICRGDTLQLFSGGGVTYHWSPSTFLNSDIFQNPVCLTDTTINYTVEVTGLNGCKKSKSLYVYVQQKPLDIFQDTSVVVGEELLLTTPPQEGMIYHWSPDSGLSCSDCPNPVINILKPQIYIVTIVDSNQCFSEKYSVFVDVLYKYTIDVPKAFTPNNDNGNDRVFVRGFGIRKLIEFSIYNRWGQLVFTTDDLNTGWDGTYNNVAQNMDTYAYTVKAEAYNGEVLTKKGYIILFR